MSGKTIAIDVDNTLADYTDGLRRWMRENYDADTLGPMPEPDCYAFEFAKGWTFPGGRFRPTHLDAVRNGLYATLTPIEGAVETVSDLKAHGWRIIIVTSRNEPGALEQTAEWLQSNDIPYDLLTGDKNTPADLYVDDDPGQLARYALRHPEAIVVAFDHDYNRDVWPGPRLTAWNDALRIETNKQPSNKERKEAA